MPNKSQAKVIKSSELGKLRYALSRTLIGAAGILKGKKRVKALIYQQKIRKEWDKRLEKLT